MISLIKNALKIYEKYYEQITYLIVGGLTTVVNFITYFILTKLFHTEPKTAHVISVVISVIFAYFPNKKYVFRSVTTTFKETLNEALLFFGGRAFAAILEIGLFFMGINIFRINDTILKIFTTVFIIILNYIISKLIVFKKK